MMLMLEIAGGIVLAFLMLAFLSQLFNFGLSLIKLILSGIILVFGITFLAWLMNELNNLAPNFSRFAGYIVNYLMVVVALSFPVLLAWTNPVMRNANKKKKMMLLVIPIIICLTITWGSFLLNNSELKSYIIGIGFVAWVLFSISLAVYVYLQEKALKSKELK